MKKRCKCKLGKVTLLSQVNVLLQACWARISMKKNTCTGNKTDQKATYPKAADGSGICKGVLLYLSRRHHKLDHNADAHLTVQQRRALCTSIDNARQPDGICYQHLHDTSNASIDSVEGAAPCKQRRCSDSAVAV